MKSLSVAFIFLFFLISSCNSQDKAAADKLAEDTSVFYLIRHSEKDRSDKANRNPNLLEKGKKRAKNWANYFEYLKFDAVYSTDYNRTKQTALPTAKANNLQLQFYSPSKLNMETLKNKHKGQRVLIVGHSNTTPMVTNNLLGEQKYKDIADNNNANLYIVTIAKGNATSELKVID